MKVNQLLVTLGFLLFLTGVLSLVLSFVGVRFTILAFLDSFGNFYSFLAKIIMVMTGIIIIYVNKTASHAK